LLSAFRINERLKKFIGVTGSGPKDNPGPKPPLDAVMSQTQLKKQVEDYLIKSQALEDYWQRPISAKELQAEIDRMAQHTKRPEVLRELFEALAKDPFVIAECLVRPILVERVIADLNAHHESLAKVLQTSRDGAADLTAAKIPRASYTLPEIFLPLECTEDTWTATSAVNAPTYELTRPHYGLEVR
jgi:hypothetical protein